MLAGMVGQARFKFMVGLGVGNLLLGNFESFIKLALKLLLICEDWYIGCYKLSLHVCKIGPEQRKQ
jgi:hypothetical protein